MKYFGLGDDGHMYDLCDCGDFDAAEQSAEVFLPVKMIWIADTDTAMQWAEFLCQQLADQFSESSTNEKT